MKRRYCGTLVIEIRDDLGCDERGAALYRGRIKLPDGRTWNFSKLSCHGGVSDAAESAITFGGNYTSDNRGDDVPEWAPPPEIADAINDGYDWLPDYVSCDEAEAIEGVSVHEEKVICETRKAQKQFDALTNLRWNECDNARSKDTDDQRIDDPS